MQFPNLVYLLPNFEMYLFVLKIAVLVNRAVEEVITIPTLRLIEDLVGYSCKYYIIVPILFFDLYFFLK